MEVCIYCKEPRKDKICCCDENHWDEIHECVNYEEEMSKSELKRIAVQTDKCKCTMSISVLGDGCRYCQPQEYIDRLHESIIEERAEFSKEREQLLGKMAMMQKFIQEISEKAPEKPDYWSSCGQCQRNTSDAEDLLSASQPEVEAFLNEVLDKVIEDCAKRAEAYSYMSSNFNALSEELRLMKKDNNG